MKKVSDQEVFSILQRIDSKDVIGRADITVLSEQTELILSNPIIRSIPESIKYLSNLKKLILSGTSISSLPDSICVLSNLEELDISGTDVFGLPESIGMLSKLEILDLNSTYLQYLPESIGQLSNLKNLNLSNTKTYMLPNSIGNLRNLLELDLRETQIKSLPLSIGGLTKLQQLDLRDTKLTKLPDTIGNLTSLQTLRVSFSNIASLPETIGELNNLQWLSLSSTKVKKLPKSLGQLVSLHTLNISNNSITVLPDSIRQLTDLKTLNLLATRITALPSWIGELPHLRHLDLSYLTLSSIPESLSQKGLPFVERQRFGYNDVGINLFNVTLTNQNKSVFLEAPALISSLYQQENMMTLRECRTIFLGDGASGKSYTIKRFLNKGKREKDEKTYPTSETPGVEILDYFATEDKESFAIHFWDFGGQQLLHSMHRCFLSEETCYVVTVKTRDNKANERARYWLRNVKTFAPQSPVLLFVNCWENDDGRRSIDEPGLRSEFPMIQKVVYCSSKQAKEGDFKENVIDPIIDIAASSKGVSKQVPSQWVKVRRAIEEESKKKNYLDRERYHELCEQNEIKNDQAPELLSFFNNLGVCFSYHRDKERKELAEYKLLNPVWLTNAIYAIIEEGRVHAKDGKIGRDEIERMLCNPAPKKVGGRQYRRTVPELIYKDYECPFILDVAIANELCYPVDENNLFFPALCDTDTPKEALNVPEKNERHVSYLLHYEYLPDSVLHRLMIRCMRNHLFVEKCWLRGMVLSVWHLHRIIIRMMDDETLYIDIYSSGEHRAYELFWVLRKHIEEINNEMLLNAEEYIMDGKADFLLEDVVAALETNGFVTRRGVRRNARELLGDFYDDSVIQSMRIEDGTINISIGKRKFTPCKKDNKALRLALYETYHHICPYCGNPLTYREMQVDHILPAHYPAPLVLKPYVDYLSTCNFNIDEPDYIENYFPAHGHCNRDKSNRVNEFTLPYWHLIAAQKAKTVIVRKKQYEKQGV